MVSVSGWTLEYDNTKVLDYDELKKSIEEFIKIYPNNKDLYLSLLDDVNKEIVFYNWNNMRFLYGDEEEIYFLKTINPYLIGSVVWENKSDEEKIELSFNDYNLVLHRASMSWWEDDEAFEIDEVNPQAERLISLNRLKELNKGNKSKENKNV